MSEFRGKVALITGGSRGIGRAVAERFGREGARIVIADQRVELGEATVAALRATDVSAIFVQVDVTVPEQMEHAVSVAVAEFGGLHYAVNAAGVSGAVKSFLDYTPDEWRAVNAVNSDGMFNALKAEIAQMMRQEPDANGQRGAIVNIASALGLVGLGQLSAYTASKHAVVGLTKDVGLEFGQHGIRVNAVCPPSTRTEMYQETLGRIEGIEPVVVATHHPIGRIAEPRDQADVIVALCRDDFRFLIGHAIAADGGWTVK